MAKLPIFRPFSDLEHVLAGEVSNWGEDLRYNHGMENSEELTKQVLGLPLDQRVEFAEKFLKILDELTSEELEQVWAAEAERRYQGFRNGTIEAFDGPEIHRLIADS